MVSDGDAWFRSRSGGRRDRRPPFRFSSSGLAEEREDRLGSLVGLSEDGNAGFRIGGAEAHQLGLALHATPPGEALAKAREVAAGFVNAPTIALAMAKRQFDAAPAQTYDQALDFEANIQPLMVQTEDFREGTNSFKEKRKAQFVGN